MISFYEPTFEFSISTGFKSARVEQQKDFCSCSSLMDLDGRTHLWEIGGYSVGWLVEEKTERFQWFPSAGERTVLGTGSGSPHFLSMEQWRWNILIPRKENKEGNRRKRRSVYVWELTQNCQAKGCVAAGPAGMSLEVSIYLSVAVRMFFLSYSSKISVRYPPRKLILEHVEESWAGCCFNLT